MPNFKSISFKMAVLQGSGQNLPPSPHVCVIQKTPYEIGLRPAHMMRLVVHNSFHVHWFVNYVCAFTIIVQKNRMIEIAHIESAHVIMQVFSLKQRPGRGRNKASLIYKVPRKMTSSPLCVNILK